MKNLIYLDFIIRIQMKMQNLCMELKNIKLWILFI